MTEPGGPNPRPSAEHSNMPRSLCAPTRTPSWRQASSSYQLAYLLLVRPALFPSSHPMSCNPSRRQIWFHPSLAGSLSMATSVLGTVPPPGKMRFARLFVMCLGPPLPSSAAIVNSWGSFLLFPQPGIPDHSSPIFFSAVPSSGGAARGAHPMCLLDVPFVSHHGL